MPGPGNEVIGQEEIQELLDVMKSGYLFRYGSLDDPKYKKKVYILENEFARYCGVKHALAVTSGSAALIVALKAIGLQPGDEVIVPAYTFVATFSSVIFSGGIPILTEIDESLNIDPKDIEKRITPRTKAIVPVHMLGNSCDMDTIMAIAKKYNLKVVEDACQANGGSYHGKKLGSIGDIGAFSLNIFKTITAGDGGLMITNDTDLYKRAFGFHDQGHSPSRSGVEVGQRNILGLNFRMNELTGAVALAQVRKMDDIISTLRSKKAKLKSAIADIPGKKFRTLNDPDGDCATLCTVIFEDVAKAAQVAKKLGTTTVDRSGWHVYANMEHVNHWLAERNLPHDKGAYPQTDDILSRSVNLTVGVVDAGLGASFGINIHSTDEEIDIVAEQFREVYS
ncbi:MAG: DegT/DnrJ/EryC1/StrS family aminotransferase [Bacteroidales bacterium]|nr:DegT/DnrJ/EryC1/StrS family aminotransferase [Bacteroidales bacterium]